MPDIDYSNYKARQTGEYKDIWQTTGKCVFCDLREKYIIYEKNGVVITSNLFPYIDGHLMIIPRRHTEDVTQITPEEWQAIHELTKIGHDLMKKALNIEDIWVLYRIIGGYKAGKTVNHSHIHLLPYSKEMLAINYQDLSISPLELSEKLRNYIKEHGV